MVDVGALVQRYSLKPYGESENTVYYSLDDDVIVAVPHEGSRDTGSSARSNRVVQVRYFREKGQKGGIIILFDRMTSQDKDARKVYGGMDDALTCSALVGGSMLTRAMFSFFLGISRPRVPVKLFADVESALRWIREVNQKVDRKLDARAAA
jgi:hypothetical protein